MNVRNVFKRLRKLEYFSKQAINEFGLTFFLLRAYEEFKDKGFKVFSGEQLASPPSDPYHFVNPFQLQNKIIPDEERYEIWLFTHTITENKRMMMKNELESFSLKPKLIIVLSVGEENKQYLKESLFSITDQNYQNLEVWLNYHPSVSKEKKLIQIHLLLVLKNRIFFKTSNK